MSRELLDGVRRGDLEGTRAAITGLAEADRCRLARPAAQLSASVPAIPATGGKGTRTR